MKSENVPVVIFAVIIVGIILYYLPSLIVASFLILGAVGAISTKKPR